MDRGRSEVYGPLEQNFVCLSFFNYNVRKLTKKHKNACVIYKSMEQCSKKVVFFSPEKVQTKLFFNFFMSYTVTEQKD